MQRMDLVHCFDLQDKSFRDNNVHLKILVEFTVLVANRKRALPDEGQPGHRQFFAPAGFIHSLQQAWAEMTMHLGRATDDATAERAIRGLVMNDPF